MPSIAMFVGSLLSMVTYCALFVGVWKIFQLGSELNEVKELLKDIKRNSNPLDAPAAPAAEAAYRPPDLAALAAEMDLEDRAYEVPADKITVLDPPR
ncbi:MAG: hypothetical protein ABI823_10225 [Bryobacteraceae bacterium]